MHNQASSINKTKRNAHAETHSACGTKYHCDLLALCLARLYVARESTIQH